MSSKKTFVNNINIKLDSNDEPLKKLKKEKKKRKKNKNKNLKKEKDKKMLQEKPPFSNYQYPQPIIVNPQQQKQLDDTYSKKVAELLQKKFDEEYAKEENEKAKLKSAAKKNNTPGAFSKHNRTSNRLVNKVNDNFSRPNLNSKQTDDFSTAKLSSEDDSDSDMPPLEEATVPIVTTTTNLNTTSIVANAVAVPEEEEPENIIEVAEVESVPVDKNGNPKWFCEVCKEHYVNTTKSIRTHSATLKHKANFAKTNPDDPRVKNVLDTLDYFTDKKDKKDMKLMKGFIGDDDPSSTSSSSSEANEKARTKSKRLEQAMQEKPPEPESEWETPPYVTKRNKDTTIDTPNTMHRNAVVFSDPEDFSPTGKLSSSNDNVKESNSDIDNFLRNIDSFSQELNTKNYLNNGDKLI